ncbi:MAG: hypothetical protein ACE5NC_07125 [Anaerolineae bacterium]
MTTFRTISYILWAVSVVVLVMGGISRLTLTPFGGIEARALLGFAIALQLYAMTLLFLEFVRQGRR